MVVTVSLSTKHFNDCGGADPFGFHGVTYGLCALESRRTMSLVKPLQHPDLATGSNMNSSNFSSRVGSSQSFSCCQASKAWPMVYVPAVLPPPCDGWPARTGALQARYRLQLVPCTSYSSKCQWRRPNLFGSLLEPRCPFMTQECPQDFAWFCIHGIVCLRSLVPPSYLYLVGARQNALHALEARDDWRHQWRSCQRSSQYRSPLSMHRRGLGICHRTEPYHLPYLQTTRWSLLLVTPHQFLGMRNPCIGFHPQIPSRSFTSSIFTFH